MLYPRRFNPIATHDNKWGWYPASRIGAIASMPGKFCDFYKKWRKRNAPLRKEGAPDERLEWQIYQGLVGFWPYPFDLFKIWLQKSMREAKIPGQTDWLNQRREWEEPVYQFVYSLYFSSDCARFREELSALVEALDPLARHAALGQLVLMMMCSGRPCFYQGDEVWEMQGVDPLNRRRQDRQGHEWLLAQIPRVDSSPSRQTNRLQMIRRLNMLRAELPEAFGAQGSYTALDAGEGVLSFARGPDKEVIVQVPQRPGMRKRVPAGYQDLLHDISPAHGVYVRRGLTETFGS
jgi:(1->4)-alpha-D-glucan 1-alpha-D-glucosylmutase